MKQFLTSRYYKGAKEKRENREKGASQGLIEAQVFSSILKGGKQVA
jgi:hypothetical protein